MTQIIKTYTDKRDFINLVSTTILKAIAQAYYRFIRAHKMVEIIKKNGHLLIQAQILLRYRSVAERIHKATYTNVMLVKETSFLISLLQVYHITSYKEGLQDSQIMVNYNGEILGRIKREYDNYANVLTDPVQK
jgi:hypothetical protein